MSSTQRVVVEDVGDRGRVNVGRGWMTWSGAGVCAGWSTGLDWGRRRGRGAKGRVITT